MRPSLPSTRQTAALALALAIPLALPALIPRSLQPPRRELYSAAGWTLGPFPWLEKQVFVERAPIDIAFAGASHVWCAIDTPAVESGLEQRRSGGGAVVRTLGWPRSGFDALYFIVKDLLEHRSVKILVVYDEIADSDNVHPVAHRWYRYADEPGALRGIPLRPALELYAASVLGMPRNLVSLFRPNREADPAPLSKNYWQSAYQAENPGDRLGSLSAQIGYNYDPRFVVFNPPPSTSVALTYPPADASGFRVTGGTIPPFQGVFLHRLADLAREHQTTLVFLDIPEFDERRNQQTTERLFWPTALPGDVRLVGVPPADLFHGMSDEEVRRLYYDPGHFNLNGQRYFTSVIAPALFQMLDE